LALKFKHLITGWIEEMLNKSLAFFKVTDFIANYDSPMVFSICPEGRVGKTILLNRMQFFIFNLSWLDGLFG